MTFDGGSSLVDVSSAPSALEQVLGRLVEAGITNADGLASALGLEPQHVGRPLRKLTLARILEPEPTAGELHVTPHGRAWLGIKATPTTPEPALVAEELSTPRLRESQIPEEMDRTPVGADTGRVRPAAADPQRARFWRLLRRRLPRGAGNWHQGTWTVSAIAVPTIRETLGGVRLAVPYVGWRRRNLQVTLDGVELSPSRARRIAAATAAAIALMIVVRLAAPGWFSTSVAALVGTGTVHDDARPLTSEPLATAPPAATSMPSERWVIVGRTNGSGLVLRPAPASTARTLTLAEGARLRVTGEPVQQDGRVWLPVVSQSGKTGWVASEFVTADP